MSKLTDDLRNKATAGWEKMRGAAQGLRGKPGVPDPGLTNNGYSNAERAAATPKGYTTGGMAAPQSRALRLAKGVGTKVIAPLAVASAIGDSMDQDSTARYAKRFGVAEPTGDGSVGDILKFAGLRAGGFASDLGKGIAGKLYRDNPSESIEQAPQAVAAAPAAGLTREAYVPGAGLPSAEQVAADKVRAGVADAGADLGARGLRQRTGGIYDTGNAPIFAGSNRADGKQNVFVGEGDPNRPNYEQRNPEDVQAAQARAAADKSSLVGLAVAKMSEGDLDGAYRLAAGDPVATAAVEGARQQRGLRVRAANGDKGAAELLQQQSVNEAGLAGKRIDAESGLAGKRIDAEATTGAAAIKAQAELRQGLAKAQSDAAKEARAQANFERTTGNAEAKQNQADTQTALEGVLGQRIMKDGTPNPAYADFEAKLNETLLQGVVGADGKPRTMQNLTPTELQDFLRQYQFEKESEPGMLGSAINFITGNSRPKSNNLMTGVAQPGTAEEGLFYDTYKDSQGQVRRLTGDLTLEQRRRAGLAAGNR